MIGSMQRRVRVTPPAPAARVSSDALAEVIDSVVEHLGEDSPAPVYQYLGRRLGIHPTTILRYHRGSLRTAPIPVMSEARQLLAQVQRHGGLPDPVGDGGSAPRRPPPPRVPSWRLAHLLDRLIEMMELSEPSALHRLLATQTGIHPTTVLRFHRGVLRSAPQQLLSAAVDLEHRVRLGEAVRFPPGGDGEATVTRAAFVRAVDAVMETGLFTDRNAMLHRVEDDLGVPRGRLTRLYRCRTFRWVPERVQRHLEQLCERCQYNPGLDYALGDRLVHHLFGAGTVEGKVPVDKIVVRFDDGTERILRERLVESRFWRQPAAAPSVEEAFALGLSGT